MKNILFILYIILYSTNTFAQEIPINIIDRVNTVEYIFEGSVIDKHSYSTSNNSNIFTTNLIQITKILKGNLTCGTVEIITEGGQVNGKEIFGPHLLDLEIGSQGVFLCRITNRELPVNPFFAPDNANSLQGFYEFQSFIQYTEENNRFVAHDIAGNYDSLIQFYNLAQIITGFNFVECNSNKLLKSNFQTIEPEIYKPEDFVTNNKILYKENIDWIAKQKLSYTRKKVRSNNSIQFSISNPIITGNNPKYCEFNINVSDNIGNKFLDIVYLRLKYPTSVFDTSIVSNNKITISKGSMISAGTCYANPVPTDLTNESILIPITETVFSQCKKQIKTTEQQLIHIKIEIKNCEYGSIIKLQDTATFLAGLTWMQGSAFSDSPSDSFSIEYDTFAILNQIVMPQCGATITNFYPKTLHGGVGDTLFIEGYQFGTQQGMGNLYFYNASYPITGMSLSLNKSDSLLWSDTLIKVIIPSIKSASSTSTVGSGKFRIENGYGQKDTSDLPIRIYYSLRNSIDTIGNVVKKNNVLHYNSNSNGGYDFYVDSLTIKNNKKAFDCIRKAMNEWICATGINFRIVGDTFGIPRKKNDENLNFITFGKVTANAAVDSFAAGVIISDNQYCNPGPPFQHFYTDIDLILSENPLFVWFYDTTGTKDVPAGQIDFYSTVLHELGHAVGHKHINDSKAIMYYKIPDNSIITPANQRAINLKTDTSAMTGGQRQVNMDAFPANFSNCANSGLNMTKLPLCEGYSFLLNINNNQQLKSEIEIFPNPFKNSITINNKGDYSNIKSIILYDLNGKILYSKNNFDNNINSETLQFDENIFKNNGIYLLKVITKNDSYSKIIRHE
jgi:Secretion system C-terminal sorting domain